MPPPKSSAKSAASPAKKPSASTGRSRKKVKSPELVPSDADDEDVPTSAQKSRVVVIHSPTKLKPKSITPEVIELSDSSQEQDNGSDLDDFIVDDDESSEDASFTAGDDDDDGDNQEVDGVSSDDVEQGGLVLSDEDSGMTDSALAKGDTMYEEPVTPARVRVSKRAAPLTPPLKTRQSSQVDIPQPDKEAGSPSVQPPPSKRARKTVVPKDNDASSDVPLASLAAGKQRSGSGKGKKKDSVQVPDNEPAKSSVTKLLPAPQLTSQPSPKKGKTTKKINDIFAALDTMTFGDVDEAPVSSSPKKESTDLIVLSIDRLPAKCSVSNPSNQCPFLKKHNLYDGLPNLSAVTVTPAREPDPRYTTFKTGPIFFVAWKEVIPGIPLRTPVESVTFSQDGKYVNLARVDPRNLLACQLFGGVYDIRVAPDDTALCLTPIMVQSSYTATLNTHLSFSAHYLSGYLHSEEFDRFFAVLGMVTKQSELVVNLFADTVTFGTRSGSSSDKASDVPSSLFNSAASPTKKALAGRPQKVEPAGLIHPLDFGTKIPVYDGRKKIGKGFAYNAKTFDNISSTFPLFKGEIPQRSFAIVGHTTQLHQGRGDDKRFKVYTYAQWVLVLACPTTE